MYVCVLMGGWVCNVFMGVGVGGFGMCLYVGGGLV